MIEVTPRLSISESELSFRFVRAAGPGGQNVNKVATAVQLRFDAMASPHLSETVKARLRILAGRRMDQTGTIQIDAHRHRTQDANRRDAVARLVDLIRRAATPAPRRIATRIPRGEKLDRLQAKKRRGGIKSGRSRRIDFD
jgi:ribosome-associated protein